ncbi:MAG: ABC transporter ATP-binding protein, partial [Caldilineaceae bacterium]|nr:ABC transporter ATP-binding protein [Caldilineaceae bacterium]
ITHRLSQIRTADQILLMKNGRLIGQGTHDELMVTNAAYRQIFVRDEAPMHTNGAIEYELRKM